MPRSFKVSPVQWMKLPAMTKSLSKLDVWTFHYRPSIITPWPFRIGYLFAVWWTILYRGPGWKWVPLWLRNFHDDPSTMPPHLPGNGGPEVGLSSWLYSATLVESPLEADGGTASTAWTVQCHSCGKEDEDDKDWKVQGIESSPSWHSINVLWLGSSRLLPTLWYHSESAQGMAKRKNCDVGCRPR